MLRSSKKEYKEKEVKETRILREDQNIKEDQERRQSHRHRDRRQSHRHREDNHENSLNMK